MSEAASAAGVIRRFAQIAYTSSRGGFGIHATQGDLTSEERDHLVRGADPERTDFGQALPRFAAPEEVAQFNRNLVHSPLGKGTTASWHTAPAGADESGRTGNVFVHAVLDRAAGQDGARIVDTWRSPDWETPYGASEVSASELPQLPPGPGALVGHRQVCEFILDPSTWRLGVLARLLDELAVPRGDRGPIVLGVRSPDAGALWVGAVTHLMSPTAAADLGFGVWETTRALQDDRASRLELICIPDGEIGSVRERYPQILVMTESQDVALRDWTEADTRGEQAWGALAVGMFSLADDAVSVLHEIDDLAHRVGDRDLSRFWPLAMAMARRIQMWEFLSHPIAAALRSGSPPQLSAQPDLLDVTVDLVGRHTGDSAADAWAALDACAPGPIGAVLQRIYLGRAVADDRWLTQPGGPPGRRDPGWSPDEHHGLAAEVGAAVERISAQDDLGARAVAMVNLVDLLVRTGWRTDDPDALCDGRLLGAVDLTTRPILASREDRDLLTSMTHITAEARRRVIRPALADWPRDIAALVHLPTGRRIPRGVLGWLYPDDPCGAELGPVLSPLDLEAISLAATEGADAAQRDRARQRLLDEALGLTEPEDAEDRAQLVAVVSESHRLRSRELRELIAGGYRPTDQQVATAVLRAGFEECDEVLGLLGVLVRQPVGPTVVGAVRTLSVVASAPAWGAPSLEAATMHYAPKVLESLSELCALTSVGAGSMWLEHLAAAVELADVRADRNGVLGTLLPPPGTLAPGLAELFSSLLLLPLEDERTARRVDMIALRALVCDTSFPKPLAPQNPTVLAHGLNDPAEASGLTAGLAKYYAALERDRLTDSRERLLSLVEQVYGENAEVFDFARVWFGRITGSRGVGERLRNVGGRLFGR